jgi:hypothetical protein
MIRGLVTSSRSDDVIIRIPAKIRRLPAFTDETFFALQLSGDEVWRALYATGTFCLGECVASDWGCCTAELFECRVRRVCNVFYLAKFLCMRGVG